MQYPTARPQHPDWQHPQHAGPAVEATVPAPGLQPTVGFAADYRRQLDGTDVSEVLRRLVAMRMLLTIDALRRCCCDRLMQLNGCSLSGTIPSFLGTLARLQVGHARDVIGICSANSTSYFPVCDCVPGARTAGYFVDWHGAGVVFVFTIANVGCARVCACACECADDIFLKETESPCTVSCA